MKNGRIEILTTKMEKKKTSNRGKLSNKRTGSPNSVGVRCTLNLYENV